jgi:hypothetical protein
LGLLIAALSASGDDPTTLLAGWTHHRSIGKLPELEERLYATMCSDRKNQSRHKAASTGVLLTLSQTRGTCIVPVQLRREPFPVSFV